METPQKNRRYQVLGRFADRLENKLKMFNRFDQRYFWLRIGTLILTLLGAVIIFIESLFLYGVSIIFLGLIGFVIVVLFHRRLDHSRLRFKIRLEHIRMQMARMRLNWDQIPLPVIGSLENDNLGQGDKFHPYIKDLNINGPRSIQHLIDTSITSGGSKRLLTWLLSECPDIDVIRARQNLVEEMSRLVGFRARLALNGALASAGSNRKWSGERIVDWLSNRVQDPSLRLYLLLLVSMSLINIALFLLNVAGRLPPFWILTLGLYGIVYNTKHRQYSDLFADTYQLGRALDQFRALFIYLERYPYPSKGRLIAICQPYWGSDQGPSDYFRRLGFFISAASLQNNPILSLLVNAIIPWDLFFAFQFNNFTIKVREMLPPWLDVWYELEALISLANFAYLNPEYIIPNLMDDKQDESQAIFDAKSLGHPLLRDDLRVCNDFKLDQLGQIVIISGSNMSGKSTFLKTLGVNLCLAFTGGPVNARSLETIIFRVFTCINVADSLTDGISYFYAEVKRLKALKDAIELDDTPPLFFLIDEIFRGTNNIERQVGSRAYVQSLVGGRGVGVISTHDLSLVHLADDQALITNFHFREDVLDKRMVFDYRLRSGPSPTTNALRIMEIEGLPVE